MAPGSSAGSSPCSNAALLPSMISAFVLPAKTISVLLYVLGKTDRAAGGLKQIGPRIFGFQNSGASAGDIHPAPPHIQTHSCLRQRFRSRAVLEPEPSPLAK